jgi:O-succinylbenzoic acid--CoA ligase
MRICDGALSGRSLLTEVVNPLRAAAREHGDEPALIDEHRTITYDQYRQAVGNTAWRLKQRGIGSGQIVAVHARPGIDYIVLLQAIWSLGAVAAPTRDNQITPNDCTALVSDADKTAGSDRVFPLAEVVACDDHAAPAVNADNIIEIDRPATLIATTGSSGTPKWVQHRYANHYYSALGSNENIRLQPGDRWLICLPLHHVSGLSIVFRAMLAATAAVIHPVKMSLRESLCRFGVTHLSLVHTQLKRLLDEGVDARAVERLKAVLVGGSAIPPGLLKRAHAAGLPLFTTYGSTEMASQVTTTRPGDPLDRLLTSGRLLGNRELRIAEDGEIMVRGATRFDGYRYEDRLEEPFDQSGWFATGDIGELDEQGYLTVLGRKDRMFISGGENIYPEQIERTLLSLPEITEAVVVPVYDPEWGYRPVAALTFEGKPPTETQLRSRLAGKLPGYLVPDRYYLWQMDREALKPTPGQVSQLIRQGCLPPLTPGS